MFKLVFIVVFGMLSLATHAAESAGQVSVDMTGNVEAGEEQPGCEISPDTANGVNFQFATFEPGAENIDSSIVEFKVDNCGETVIKLTTSDEDPFLADNSTPDNGLFAQHISDETSEQSALNVDLSSSTAVFSAEGETINTDSETAVIDITATIVSDTTDLDDGDIEAASSQFIYVYFSTGATGS